MHLISHRGNISGKTNRENDPIYIIAALDLGFDVEIDVWYIDGKWWLGHDEPQHEVKIDWLKNRRLWCHAKNIEAAYYMYAIGGPHYFFHQTDDITLTSRNYLWTFPGKLPLTPNSIAVLPENTTWEEADLKLCAGICSDFIDNYIRLK